MDISDAIKAKSDQLNYDDIADSDMILSITNVLVKRGDQPVTINYHGDNGKPWKPSKGMLRILATGWGRDSSNWVGKLVKVYGDSSVVWAGKPVGGIRIKAMSNIDQAGIKTMLATSKGKRQVFTVSYLEPPTAPIYPNDQFEAALPQMLEAMKNGWTIDQIIAECSNTGQLTDSQIAKLMI